MASITVQRTAECAGQGHITITVTGDVAFTYNGTRDELLTAITNEEREAFIKLLCRFAKIGRTNAQFRTLMGTGFTVTI